jgi:hypothetical protein
MIIYGALLRYEAEARERGESERDEKEGGKAEG